MHYLNTKYSNIILVDAVENFYGDMKDIKHMRHFILSSKEANFEILLWYTEIIK